MTSAVRVFVAGWLLASAAAAQRLGAMELVPTLSPRFYLSASPMAPGVHEAHQHGGATLRKRQALCAANQHSCLDIGSIGASVCCDDSSYCIVNTTDLSRASCCAIGSTCDSPCSETEYECNVTSTITTASSTTTTVSEACCPRKCAGTTQFLCPSSLSGGCCNYGQTCGIRSGTGECIYTQTQTSTTSALVSEIPPGCTTSQIACPSSLGGGCCDATMSCTSVTGTALCATITVTPTASGIIVVVPADDGGGGGLSGGAEAGIAVGVICGCGLVIGVVTWWCLRRRKRSRSETAGDGTAAGGPAVAGVGEGPDVSAIGSESISHGDLPRDYFHPDALYGLSNETHDAPPGTLSGPDRRGVPVAPYDPSDITAPVEIDSSAKRRQSVGPAQQKASGSASGRFELYGSEPQNNTEQDPPTAISPSTPSPTPPDEAPPMQNLDENPPYRDH